MWLIWCHERGMWWRAGARGYTADITKAGRYTFDQAEQICQQANQGLLFGRKIQETIVRAPEDVPDGPRAEFTRDRFHNALRILLNLDMHVLEDAGVINKGSNAEWNIFRENPWRWFIRADGPTVKKLWDAMIAQGMMQ